MHHRTKIFWLFQYKTWISVRIKFLNFFVVSTCSMYLLSTYYFAHSDKKLKIQTDRIFSVFQTIKIKIFQKIDDFYHIW